MAMTYEERIGRQGQSHSLSLSERRKLNVSGVSDVESFDEETVSLSTAGGTRTVRGSGLKIEKLSLDGGELKVSGLDRLLQYPEFSDTEGLGELLGALEQKDAILDLVSDTDSDRVSVVIGSESSVKVINNSTIVFKPIKNKGKTVGAIGVIGPLRMDYARVLATLDSLGGNITQLLTEPKYLEKGENHDG